ADARGSNRACRAEDKDADQRPAAVLPVQERPHGGEPRQGDRQGAEAGEALAVTAVKSHGHASSLAAPLPASAAPGSGLSSAVRHARVCCARGASWPAARNGLASISSPLSRRSPATSSTSYQLGRVMTGSVSSAARASVWRSTRSLLQATSSNSRRR